MLYHLRFHLRASLKNCKATRKQAWHFNQVSPIPVYSKFQPPQSSQLSWDVQQSWNQPVWHWSHVAAIHLTHIAKSIKSEVGLTNKFQIKHICSLNEKTQTLQSQAAIKEQFLFVLVHGTNAMPDPTKVFWRSASQIPARVQQSLVRQSCQGAASFNHECWRKEEGSVHIFSKMVWWSRISYKHIATLKQGWTKCFKTLIAPAWTVKAKLVEVQFKLVPHFIGNSDLAVLCKVNRDLDRPNQNTATWQVQTYQWQLNWQLNYFDQKLWSRTCCCTPLLWSGTSRSLLPAQSHCIHWQPAWRLGEDLESDAPPSKHQLRFNFEPLMAGSFNMFCDAISSGAMWVSVRVMCVSSSEVSISPVPWSP